MRFAVAVLLLVAISPSVAEVLIPRGSIWKYYAEGPVVSTWNRTNFDDGTWPSGPAKLGYGEGDEQTFVSAPTNTPTTCYFRRTFIASTQKIASVTLRLLADDGAVVYLNGVRVLAKNMAPVQSSYDSPL
jgi:hypothetical protein